MQKTLLWVFCSDMDSIFEEHIGSLVGVLIRWSWWVG